MDKMEKWLEGDSKLGDLLLSMTQGKAGEARFSRKTCRRVTSSYGSSDPDRREGG